MGVSSHQPPSEREAPARGWKAGACGRRLWDQTRSKIAAMPWPPPMHIVTSA
jgi:hypothetical protein